MTAKQKAERHLDNFNRWGNLGTIIAIVSLGITIFFKFGDIKDSITNQINQIYIRIETREAYRKMDSVINAKDHIAFAKACNEFKRSFFNKSKPYKATPPKEETSQNNEAIGVTSYYLKQFNNKNFKTDNK